MTLRPATAATDATVGMPLGERRALREVARLRAELAQRPDRVAEDALRTIALWVSDQDVLESAYGSARATLERIAELAAVTLAGRSR